MARKVDDLCAHSDSRLVLGALARFHQRVDTVILRGWRSGDVPETSPTESARRNELSGFAPMRLRDVPVLCLASSASKSERCSGTIQIAMCCRTIGHGSVPAFALRTKNFPRCAGSRD